MIFHYFCSPWYANTDDRMISVSLFAFYFYQYNVQNNNIFLPNTNSAVL
ncbi:hypothetical protein CAter282_1848 [Collimonas arenae]|uniref:Uncharacterized protein n=1 Tax=Collimonas arenae TaxID=279058 RepID=A0A127QHT8_9BURK|nr:hypothetical protein CAter10_1994 [Collimonas arenae]AMP09621.1 hypothetical protein CAter282_1848 [Collimonas arenae]